MATGLHRKPLDSAIGRLLAPYCPGDRQGRNQQNNDDTNTMYYSTFAAHFDVDGRGGAPVLYRVHRLMEEVHGFLKSH